ncbi:hypothetical protein EDC96DRAFT_571850 [Choanephora cucurbitarum]|nr:hypothetical protein EDC96DRAFT_571850 [Choanephora cucurbitarum]
MSQAQQLCVAFEKISDYLRRFDRNYNEQELKEKTSCDILISSDDQLSHLWGKVDHFALYKLQKELYKERPAIPARYSECVFKNRVVYGLLCCHQLDGLKKRRIELNDIPRRWMIPKTHEHLHNPVKSFSKPWVKYLLALDEAFRVAEGDLVETFRLTDVLDNLLHVDNNSFVDGGSRTKFQSENIPPLQLLEASEVRKPGRPAKLQRMSSLPKDFAKAAFRKQYSKINLKKQQQNKKEDEKENNEDVTYDIDADDGCELIFDLTRKKRKSVPLSDEIIIPKRQKRTILRSRVQEISLPLVLHPSIPKADIAEVYDPLSDGHCGFRSASFLVHGNKSFYPLIKQEMLRTLKENKDIYESFLGMDIKEVEKRIVCEIDVVTDEMKTASTKDGQGGITTEDGAEAMGYIIEEGEEFNLRNLTNLSEYNDCQPVSIELDAEDENLESRISLVIEKVNKTIADKVGNLELPRETAQTWAKRIRTEPSWNIYEKQTNKSSRAKSQLQEPQKLHILELFDNKPYTTIDEVVDSLTKAFEGFTLKQSTVNSFILHECNLTIKRLQRQHKARNDPARTQARYDWVMKYDSSDMDFLRNCIFIDESGLRYQHEAFVWTISFWCSSYRFNTICKS